MVQKRRTEGPIAYRCAVFEDLAHQLEQAAYTPFALLKASDVILYRRSTVENKCMVLLRRHKHAG